MKLFANLSKKFHNISVLTLSKVLVALMVVNAVIAAVLVVGAFIK